MITSGREKKNIEPIIWDWIVPSLYIFSIINNVEYELSLSLLLRLLPMPHPSHSLTWPLLSPPKRGRNHRTRPIPAISPHPTGPATAIAYTEQDKQAVVCPWEAASQAGRQSLIQNREDNFDRKKQKKDRNIPSNIIKNLFQFLRKHPHLTSFLQQSTSPHDCEAIPGLILKLNEIMNQQGSYIRPIVLQALWKG